MTKRLLDAGYPVAVYDPTPPRWRRSSSAARGGGHAGRGRPGAAFILCSLPNPAILREPSPVRTGCCRAPSPAR